MEPTKERWFWERCGLQYCTPQTGDTTPFIEMPDGVIWGGWNFPIDLNNLFKYAVPKLEEWGMKQNIGSACTYVWVRHNGIQWVETEETDPAQALFWAIYKAFGGWSKEV